MVYIEVDKLVRVETKTGKQLAQVYLIIFSFIFPSSLDLISKSQNTAAILFVTISATVFMLTIILYIFFMSKPVQLLKLHCFYVNGTGAIASVSIAFILSLYLVIYLQMNHVLTDVGDIYFFFMTILSNALLAVVFSLTLVCMSLKLKDSENTEVPINGYAFLAVNPDLLNDVDNYFLSAIKSGYAIFIIVYFISLYFSYCVFRPVF